MKIFGVEINIKNNAKETEKDFENLNDTLDETAKATDEVNESFDKGATFAQRYGDELEPLTTRMGEAEDRLYELALAGDTTSKEYQELLTQVGNYRKVQIQTDLAVDGAAQTMSQKLGSALTGATSGFAATQGAMALFGDENQALEESLLKVQAALAIQQGVDGLRTSFKELSIGTKLASTAQAAFSFVTGGATVAMKAFRGALLATGIGALVIGVAALIENFDKVTATIKNALSFALKPLKKAIDEVVDAYYAVTDALGITDTEAEKLAQNQKRRAEEENKRTQEIIKQNKALGAERRKQFIAEKKRIETLKRIRQEDFDLNIALLESEGKNTIRLRKQRAKELLEEAKENEEIQRRGGLTNFGLFKEAQEKRIKAQIVYNNILKEQRAANASKEKEEEKIEFDGKIERLQIQAATEVDIDKEKNEQIAKNAEAARERQKAAAQSLADTEKAIQDARMANIEAGISLFKDLVGENNKLQALAIAAESAVSIAKTIIATQAANAAATAQGTALAITTGGASVAAAAALVTQNNIAAGISIAAQIAAAAKGISALGGGASPASGGSLGGDAGGEAQAPSFNVVGDSGINQLAQLQQAPVQAFVVSGEVTTSQALDRNRVENATL